MAYYKTKNGIKADGKGQDFACSRCGQIYKSSFACVCPFCAESIVRQVAITDLDAFNRGFYTHRVKPTNFHSKKINGIPKLSVIDEQSIADYQDSYVTVDWLSFTVKRSEFRHCKKSGLYSGFPFPDAPVLSECTAESDIDAQDILSCHQKMMESYIDECIRIFTQRVLGFSYGAARGRGFNFYDDSFALLAENADNYCGQVGFGGNDDTIHFSITGDGCRYLFAQRSKEFVHYWLSKVLGVTLLSRIDLAYDDFSGVHTPFAAERVCKLGGFARSRGISPQVKNCDEFSFNSKVDGGREYSRIERDFGSRQSLVYWRIYDKKLESKIYKEGFHWNRSEVELKKFTVDVLLNPQGYFVGLNDYAASLLPISVKPLKISSLSKKRIACDILKATYWAKRQYGRLINSLNILFDGDLEKVFSSLIKDDVILTFPSTHSQLINSLE